ncbi:MAG TPA: chemotaxis protein CheW [Isosphaeraceae bacterium]|nr:chemotaxis protein CheW [Isosphaeraceae bacterium]
MNPMRRPAGGTADSGPLSLRRRRSTERDDGLSIHERLARVAAAIGAEPRLTPEQARAVLEERARALAQVPAGGPADDEALEVVTFSLASQDYAIELGSVRKIVPLGELTPVPGAPDAFAGVINLRGELLAVIDLRRLLSLSGGSRSDPAWVIVLGGERNEFGLLADAVGEVRTLRTLEVLVVQAAGMGPGQRSLHGVTEDGLIVLDGAVLLQDDRLVVDQGEGAGV